ncbi:hypothetical protein PHLGIDRAFT_127576 [Phlebiopsis gigantea 11061_1 CR5-6]|uniref:SH3 domain-containing protein n=1 Tax=Phlebiopsis gigantea (strain 11061_1 CR5-6) TaxID=745531 RepID=A0A0C3SB18_PHLG1|nr:hypothetical protein PHLGIDRAFT_127576 [Phlebiopsis gigantea 11061_1 CR5-6]
MASAVVQEPTRDIPALTLTVDHSSSSSPFPSPGSGFLPPPKLGAHEFALRNSPVEQTLRTISAKRKSQDEMNGTSKPQIADGESTPTVPPPLASPVTPTPATFSPPPPQVIIPDWHHASLVTPTEKTSHRESLSSSRPAPPSPAVSRRASSTISHSSRARSRPQSRVTSLSQQYLPADDHTEASSSTVMPAKFPVVVLKIRDFGYPAEDERHAGKGPDAPRPNRPRNRGSTYSSSSSSACSDDEEDQQRNSFSSFRWNTLSTHVWGGKDTDAGDAGPSQVDFGRNFEGDADEEDEGDDDYDDEPPADDEPLIPGIYRALYAFEPEGTAEIALEEEQVVHVVGRGGGVGWAIVETEGGGHSLVPESYLELMQADEPSSPS